MGTRERTETVAGGEEGVVPIRRGEVLCCTFHMFGRDQEEGGCDAVSEGGIIIWLGMCCM